MMNSDNFNARPRRQFGPVPVKEGDTYDVTIEGIGEKGDGIAKIQGFVIVVPKTQQGQRVKIRITAVRGKVSFGEVVGEATSEEPAATEEENTSEESEDMESTSEEEK